MITICQRSNSVDSSTSAERFVLVLLQVIIQSLVHFAFFLCYCGILVNFAIGYKYTNSSKRRKNSLQDFFIISLRAKFMPSCVFHSARVFLKTLMLKGLYESLVARNCLCYCKNNLRSGSIFVSLGETFRRDGRNEK